MKEMMMGVYIKGMEMPESCYDCILNNAFFRNLNCAKLPGMTGFDEFPYTKSRNPACPLHHVPDHGDLIDRDEALESLMYGMNMTGYQSDAMDCLREWFVHTIIPAERGEE